MNILNETHHSAYIDLKTGGNYKKGSSFEYKGNKISSEDDKKALNSNNLLSKSKSQRPEEFVLELDKLFKKTKTIPCIYYLPITEEVVKERKRNLNENKK